MHSATNSLPTPLSPMIITVASVGATRWISANVCFIAAERPSKFPKPSSCNVIEASTVDRLQKKITDAQMQILQHAAGFLVITLFVSALCPSNSDSRDAVLRHSRGNASDSNTRDAHEELHARPHVIFVA